MRHSPVRLPAWSPPGLPLAAVWLLTGLLVTSMADAVDEQVVEVAEEKAEVLEVKASAEGGVEAPDAEDKLTRTEAQAVDPAGQEALDDAITCLARTMYWEAKGEGDEAMAAVANVVMNRLGHEGFANTVCGVVLEGQETGSCQFSWWCDGRLDEVEEEVPYARAKQIARRALNGELPDLTDGATYFHHQRLNPSWASVYTRTTTVGEHVFYRPANGAAR